MVKPTGPTNYELVQLLEVLKTKAQNNNFWRRVAEDLQKPSRQRREVNLYKINEQARKGEIILVPGKVLSLGELDKSVVVAAVNFSSQAREKILQAKGKTLSITELLQQNPEAKKVRIMG